MGIDLHQEAFDEGTLLKLELFKMYLQTWLPTFIAKREAIWKNLHIIDFFAGPGVDSQGNMGSPKIILEEVLKAQYHGRSLQDHLEEKKLRITLHFNEFMPAKFDALQKLVGTETGRSSRIQTVLSNYDFQTAFKQKKAVMGDKNSVCLLFLDQNGIKQITERVFRSLISFPRTDFLFFISSSYINRFKDHESFCRYLNTSKISFDGKHFYDSHRIVLDYYRQQIPYGVKAYLAPFSIKKGSNIYGLIFGTQHSFGSEKFLQVCWNIDPDRGEANFDIDNEKIDKTSPYLFQELNRPKKIRKFEKDLETYLRKAGPKTRTRILYNWGLEQGFTPKHTQEVLKRLIQKGVVSNKVSLYSSKVHKIPENEFIELNL